MSTCERSARSPLMLSMSAALPASSRLAFSTITCAKRSRARSGAHGRGRRSGARLGGRVSSCRRERLTRRTGTAGDQKASAGMPPAHTPPPPRAHLQPDAQRLAPARELACLLGDAELAAAALAQHERHLRLPVAQVGLEVLRGDKRDGRGGNVMCAGWVGG